MDLSFSFQWILVSSRHFWPETLLYTLNNSKFQLILTENCFTPITHKRFSPNTNPILQDPTNPKIWCHMWMAPWWNILDNWLFRKCPPLPFRLLEGSVFSLFVKNVWSWFSLIRVTFLSEHCAANEYKQNLSKLWYF